jgi:hypothetical protein
MIEKKPDRSADKTAKSVDTQTKISAVAKPESMAKRSTRIRLTKAESALLKAIHATFEQNRYDVISEADPETVQGLIDKGRIRVRKIERTKLPGSRFTHEQARRALRAAKSRQTPSN